MRNHISSGSNAQRHDLAENGMDSELQSDDQLFQALVSGCHIENAASIAGISVRTAYRRLADPTFRSQNHSRWVSMKSRRLSTSR